MTEYEKEMFTNNIWISIFLSIQLTTWVIVRVGELL